MITVNALSKSYSRGRKVLRSLSFQAAPGEITLLVGANGVGKSTTLRILSGLTRPDDGDALIAGYSLRDDPFQARRHSSFLPQQIAFHPRLTCEAILTFYAGLRGISPCQTRVKALLEQVGLTSETDKRSHALSGGLRQRLGLAVLLLPEVPVLLLDEPGLSLDPEWRERLIQQLTRERDRGKTILIATHLLAEWEGVADRALQILPGGEVASLNPHRLKEAFFSA